MFFIIFALCNIFGFVPLSRTRIEYFMFLNTGQAKNIRQKPCTFCFTFLRTCLEFSRTLILIFFLLLQYSSTLIIYKERYLDCDWSISVQLIPNRSAKICNSAKISNVENRECNFFNKTNKHGG